MEFIPTELLNDVNKLAKKQSKKPIGRPSGFSSNKNENALNVLFNDSNSSINDLSREQVKEMRSKAGEERALVNAMQAKTNSVKPENAFSHANTAKRMSHLIDNNDSSQAKLAFLYEGPQEEPAPENIDNFSPQALLETPNPPMNTSNIKVAISTKKEIPADKLFPSLKPVTRKEVAILHNTMMKLLQSISANGDQPYPSEMHAFLNVIQEEQKIYDTVFQEVIRQVTINMSERGELLAEVRKRYGNMFLKIPRHVQHIHNELIAQRKLNRRLSEEVVRAKDSVAQLIKELDFIKRHDADITKQAQDTHERLVAILTQSDNTDEVLEEYHKLYRMQRDRLEEALQVSEQEKRIWIDACTSLATRIGQEHGINEIMQLQKFENGRIRTTNDIIVQITNANDLSLNILDKKITEWRNDVIKLSQTIVEEDTMNVEVLAILLSEMKVVSKNLEVNEPNDTIEAEHHLLKAFHVYDSKVVINDLHRWSKQLSSISSRFTGDNNVDVFLTEDITQVQKATKIWLDLGVDLLRRCQKSANGKEYRGLSDILSNISIEIEEWLAKIESRVSGEDGVASQIITLQNQVEDRFTSLNTRDVDKILPAAERNLLRESLFIWTDNITTLSDALSNTTEKEQHKTPLHVETWLSKLIDQINTDTDIRTDGNMKLHNSMVSWMVHLLVKGGREAASEAWDNEFHVLSHEIKAYNQNLMRDATDIEIMADDRNDMKKTLGTICENWIQSAVKLLVQEKKSSEANHPDHIPSTLTQKQKATLKEVS